MLDEADIWGGGLRGVVLGVLFAERSAAEYHARFHFEETITIDHRDVCFMLGRGSRVADWFL